MTTMNEFLDKALTGVELNEKRKELKTHNITVKLVDFSDEKDEPAYDVETNIDGKAVMGGGSKQVFSTQKDGKNGARKKAEKRIQEILSKIKKLGEE